MKDRTPVLYALKKVAYDKAEFHVAIEKTEQFYNIPLQELFHTTFNNIFFKSPKL